MPQESHEKRALQATPNGNVFVEVVGAEHQREGFSISDSVPAPESRCTLTRAAAASRALDRAGFKLIASGLEKCVSDGSEQSAADRAQLEKLFLALA